MKIALICSNSASGGLIKYINSFLSTKTEHIVNLYCGESLKVKDSRFVNVIRTKYSNEKGLDLLFNKKLNDKLIYLIDEFNPDVVLFMNGFIRKGLEQYRIISIVHNQLAINYSMLIRQRPLKLVISLLMVSKAVRMSLKKADGIIFLSDASKNETDKLGFKYKSGKVIYFGHDVNGLEGTAIPNKNELVYVSTYYPYKNHKRLIKGLGVVKKHINDFHINIIGCPLTASLKKLIESENLCKNITFHGWLTHEETIELVKKANIYIHASLIESTSNGVLEGVFEGNTIVCSEIDVFKEALNDKAYYFNPYDKYSIASNILDAIKNPKPFSKDDCTEILSKYDFEKMVFDVYNFAEQVY